MQSEKAGEQTAIDFIANLNKVDGNNFTLIHQGKGSGTLDLVFFDEASGKCIVIEAKGGNSALGIKKIGEEYAMQGTKEYLEAILKLMEDSNPEIVEKIKLAKNNGKMDYILVHQKFNTKGDLLPTEIKQFKLQ